MEPHLRLVLLGFAIFLAAGTQGAVHYVDASNVNSDPPYLTWQTAAATIQDAVDLADPNDEIVVTNGLYGTGGRAPIGTLVNRVYIDRPLNIHSINGPDFTTIRGVQVTGTTNGDGAIRCVLFLGAGILSGFTIKDGATLTNGDLNVERQGGGILYVDNLTGPSIVSNCVVSGCSAFSSGGGAAGGTYYNCVFTNNSCSNGGGGGPGSYFDCVFIHNVGTYGGGVDSGYLSGCKFIENFAQHGGGSWQAGSTNCVFVGNSAAVEGGAASGGSFADQSYCNLASSILVSNTAPIGGGVYSGQLINCTLIGNSASNSGGAISRCLMGNSISYYNSAPADANFDPASTLTNCCTTPLALRGPRNFTNEPAFLDLAAGNYRLQSNSPCIDAGYNSLLTNALSQVLLTDFDGQTRMVNGTVDVGAFEFRSEADGLFRSWLQQYGLSADGSADLADSDGDGLNNWQEWISGTVPTNWFSALRILSATPKPSGVTLRWESVTNRTYLVQRCTSISPQAFVTVKSNIMGQPGTTTYTDPIAAAGTSFYRIGIQ